MVTRREIRVLDTPDALFRAAAEEFGRRASAAVQQHGRFCVALSGGSTPRSLYRLLASGAIPSLPWQKTLIFWGDERHVPPDHADSNYRMVQEALLSRVALPSENVFRIKAENPDAAGAALDYEKILTECFRLKPGQFPSFDLILLGTGTEGHTASLFPDSAALAERQRLVVSNWVEKLHTDRITFTLPVLNHAACVMFLVSGRDKAAIVHELLNPNQNAGQLPAQMVQPIDGELLWFLDKDAAGT